MGEAAEKPDYLGHRARLRDRLIAEPDSLQDYELVEYLLMLGIPRVDTKPIAKALLREFGGIGGVFAAEPDALRRVKGLGDAGIGALRIARAAALALLKAEISDRPMLGNWQALLDYLRADMAAAPIERVRVLFLNTRNILIRDEVMAQGSIDQAPLYVREIIRRAIDLGAAAIIVVHNHPSGDPKPSRADIDTTKLLIDAGRKLGIAVHDHLILAANGHASMKALGLI
jgi:DNA repair protein RadC